MKRDEKLESAEEFKARCKTLIESQYHLIPKILGRLNMHSPGCAKRRCVIAGFITAFRHSESLERFYETAEFYGFQRACKHNAAVHPGYDVRVPLAAVRRKVR